MKSIIFNKTPIGKIVSNHWDIEEVVKVNDIKKILLNRIKELKVELKDKNRKGKLTNVKLGRADQLSQDAKLEHKIEKAYTGFIAMETRQIPTDDELQAIIEELNKLLEEIK